MNALENNIQFLVYKDIILAIIDMIQFCGDALSVIHLYGDYPCCVLVRVAKMDLNKQLNKPYFDWMKTKCLFGYEYFFTSFKLVKIISYYHA